MTVCVAVRTNDAMVFAADSASTLIRNTEGKSEVVNVYLHGDKIFNLYKGLPLVAMTCGMGNLGDRAISTLAKDLRRRLVHGSREWKIDPHSYTVEQVAERAKKLLFDERYRAIQPAPAEPHQFEFWVGGYSSDSEIHDLRQIVISNGECRLSQMGGAGNCGIRWGGQPEVITRLLKGFSPSLAQALIDKGMAPSDATQIDLFVKTNFEINLCQPSMPVQDAIDLAQFLVETTKGFVRFQSGADTVGGETEIAVITQFEGFKWIKRKHYYPPHLNPLETDHVGESQNWSCSLEPAARGAYAPNNAGVQVPKPSVRKSYRRRETTRRRKK